jgi:hypothetical protein
MATQESLFDHVWGKVGPACREHVHETMRLIERADPEDRAKILACFFWANWCRGRSDLNAGKGKFWDME